MKKYVVLLRGINVGGKNKLSMSQIKSCLETEGFENVTTYIQSGNIVLTSDLSENSICKKIESVLSQEFKLDSQLIKVLAISEKAFRKIVANAPKKFETENPDYRYDVIFLIDVSMNEATKQIEVRDGIEKLWYGDNVIYFQRPSVSNPNATKGYLVKITTKPIYKSITIRNWKTTNNLIELLDK